MTNDEIVESLESVLVRLLDLQEWECSKKIECIKKAIQGYEPEEISQKSEMKGKLILV